MSRFLLRAAATLMFIHAALTFVASVAIFHSLSADLLGFAAHGFVFVLLAGLNLVVWELGLHSPVARYFTHACNASFLAFCVLFAYFKREPPMFVAVAIVLLLTIAGALRDFRLVAARSLGQDG